jgi:hypothetical protein
MTNSKSIHKFNDDRIMSELMWCDGHASCILSKLDELGLYGCDFTLEEIGAVLHVTRERVRQIEATAIKKLKHPKVGRVIKKYIEM